MRQTLPPKTVISVNEMLMATSNQLRDGKQSNHDSYDSDYDLLALINRQDQDRKLLAYSQPTFRALFTTNITIKKMTEKKD